MSPTTPSYVVANCRPWGSSTFAQKTVGAPGNWVFAGTRQDLADVLARTDDVQFIFFVHWSWIVPARYLEQYPCVCFHMTDVPYGRGGSPLQNLISRGHRETVVTALHMTGELDAGPVYMKRPLSLEGGTAEEIYLRASGIALEMALALATNPVAPVPQSGEPTTFSRRTPPQSRIADPADLLALHDFIRMLDAEGYPHAFLEIGNFRFEFRRSSLSHDRIEADVTITQKDKIT